MIFTKIILKGKRKYFQNITTTSLFLKHTQNLHLFGVKFFQSKLEIKVRGLQEISIYMERQVCFQCKYTKQKKIHTKQKLLFSKSWKQFISLLKCCIQKHVKISRNQYVIL